MPRAGRCSEQFVNRIAFRLAAGRVGGRGIVLALECGKAGGGAFVAAFGGAAVPQQRLFAVLADAAPLLVEHAEIVLGGGVALAGGFVVPQRRHFVVFGDVFALPVEMPQLVLRFGVARFGLAADALKLGQRALHRLPLLPFAFEAEFAGGIAQAALAVEIQALGVETALIAAAVGKAAVGGGSGKAAGAAFAVGYRQHAFAGGAAAGHAAGVAVGAG